jgi:hypothetical protein
MPKWEISPSTSSLGDVSGAKKRCLIWEMKSGRDCQAVYFYLTVSFPVFLAHPTGLWHCGFLIQRHKNVLFIESLFGHNCIGWDRPSV